MTSPHSALARLSDDELLIEVRRLAADERGAIAALIASLAELDERRLYLGAGYSSLFAYCVRALGLSEDAAYFRIEAARATRRFPIILERLASGWITLTAVKLLAPHLTLDNHLALLDEARGRTRREVEEIVARVAPRPDVAPVVRKLPNPRSTAAAPSLPMIGQTPTPPAVASESSRVMNRPPAVRPAVVMPLAPERYKIQITVGVEAHAALRRLQGLLRHEIPDGDPAAIIGRALAMLLARVERTKCAAKRSAARKGTCRSARRTGRAATAGNQGEVTSGAPSSGELGSERVDATDQETAGIQGLDAERPSLTEKQRNVASPGPRPRVHGGGQRRPRSRYIPAAVRRAVWRRDEGRCTYVGTDGRCGETGLLEYHHAIPFADGGEATVQNLRLTCKRHNQLEADRFFGAGEPPGRGR